MSAQAEVVTIKRCPLGKVPLYLKMVVLLSSSFHTLSFSCPVSTRTSHSQFASYFILLPPSYPYPPTYWTKAGQWVPNGPTRICWYRGEGILNHWEHLLIKVHDCLDQLEVQPDALTWPGTKVATLNRVWIRWYVTYIQLYSSLPWWLKYCIYHKLSSFKIASTKVSRAFKISLWCKQQNWPLKS